MAKIRKILDRASTVSATGEDNMIPSVGIPGTIQAYIEGTGGATVAISVSLDGIHWVSVGTITLTTTDGDTGEIAINQIWNRVKATVTSIGASSYVSVLAAF